LNPKNRPNLTQHCKRFTTASTSMQAAVLPWHYDEKWAPQTHYMLKGNTASNIKIDFPY